MGSTSIQLLFNGCSTSIQLLVFRPKPSLAGLVATNVELGGVLEEDEKLNVRW